MKELIRIEDAMNAQVFSRDLKEYVVPVREIKRLPRIDEPKEREEDQREMLRVLFNRCIAMMGESGMCAFCGMIAECKRYRSVLKDGLI